MVNRSSREQTPQKISSYACIRLGSNSPSAPGVAREQLKGKEAEPPS